VFFLSAIIYLIGALVFGLISKGDTQDWAIRLSDLEKNDSMVTETVQSKLNSGHTKREVVNESYE
jgi:hypothetical protein